MPTFAQVLKGTRARKSVHLPLPGAQPDPVTGEWVGPTMPLDVQIIRNDQFDDVLERARKFARSRGVENPEDGDALYERGKMLHTLATVCIDQESPVDAPRPFFTGWEEIHTSEILTPEVVAYLYTQWELFQEEISPLAKDMTPAFFLAGAVKTAQGDMSFFVNLRPGMRWIFTRTLASQLLASRTPSSPSSPSSEPQTSTTTSASPLPAPSGEELPPTE